MKAKTVTLLLILFTTLNLNAQKPKIGLTGGYQNMIAKASLLGFTESDNSSGFFIGLNFEFEISEKVKIQPGLNFSQAIETSESSTILMLPIMVKYYVNNKFYFQGGPTLDLLLEDAEEINKLGIGVGLGAGFDISGNFYLSSKYVFGINNRFNYLDDNFSGLPIDVSSIKMKFNYLNFGVGYYF